MKFDYMQKLGSGCFGIVYPLEAGKVIKFGKIEADREFFELHAAKAGVSLFPAYYGTKDDVIYEERVKGQINTEVGTGIVVQQLKQTFSQAVGEGRIPFKVLEDKLYELEEKLFRFSVETGIILDDLHGGNLMFDEHDNLYVSDVGIWFEVAQDKDDEYIRTVVAECISAWCDLDGCNYGNSEFLDEQNAFQSRFSL